MIGTPEGLEDPCLDGVGRGKTGTGWAGQWTRRIAIGVVGAAYFAAVLFDIRADGGREAALFFGIPGFLITFPILLLLGKLMVAAVSKMRMLVAGARTTVILAPTVLLAGLIAYEGYRTTDPAVKFQRFLAAPAPPSLRIMTAYTYKGINFRVWAFHFRITPEDLPRILAGRPYRHEIDPAGFDLDQVRDNGRGRRGYRVPSPDFSAIHRYQSHSPNGRPGYDVTLYGDAAQAEFYAFGYVE
jgi:hypothetical protein